MPSTVSPVLPSGSLGAVPQPVIDADGLRLRAWTADDAPVVFAAFADPSIRLWHRRRAESVAEAADWIAAWRHAWTAETSATWAVTEGDEVVGRVGLSRLELAEGQAEMAYWTLPRARRRAVASRAVRALTGWAFATGFARLALVHSTANAGSCAVAERTGFALEGVQRGGLLHEDGWHDMHVHSRLSPASP